MNTTSVNLPQKQKTTPRIEKFIKRLSNPFLFRLYLLAKLPLAFIARTKIVSITPQAAQTSIPYGWLNQNPFRSTYFAALSMAGEMATGVLGLMAIDNSEYPIAILVVNIQAEFAKKATDLTTFTCTDGQLFFDAVAETMQTGEAVQVKATSIGRNKAGDEVARFYVTWSLKKRKSKS